jgi:hypothetical protein
VLCDGDPCEDLPGLLSQATLLSTAYHPLLGGSPTGVTRTSSQGRNSSSSRPFVCTYIAYGNAKSIPGVCNRREPQFVIAYASKIIFDAKHQVCMRQESRCCHGNCPGCPEANTGVSLAGSLAGCHRQPGTTMPPGGPACNLSVVGVATRLSPASRCAAVPVVDRELVMAKRPAASAFRMAECFHSVVMGCPPG